MTRLLKQLLLVLVILISIDMGIGLIMNKLSPYIKYGSYKLISDYFNKVNDFDVIIFGNSRGMHQYVPQVFEDNMESRTINAGMDGAGLSYYRVLISYLLNRHQPKLIIIDINNRELEDTGPGVGDLTTSINYLSPFFIKIPETLEHLQLPTIDKVLYNSNLYRYNTKIYALMRSCIVNKKSDIYQGYSPFYGKAPRDLRDYKNPVKVIDQKRIEDLEYIINLAKQHNAKLLFVFSPKLNIDDRNYEARNLLTSILTKHQLPYFDFTGDKRFYDEKLFYDNAHLNHNGSLMFCRILTDMIKCSNLVND